MEKIINKGEINVEEVSKPMIKWEFLSPLWMFSLLVCIYRLYWGGTYYSSKYKVVYNSANTRITAVLMIIFWTSLYLYEWKKIRLNVHLILILAVVMMVVMFFGCDIFPWWNQWVSIPLIIIWYPIHRRILKSLPQKDSPSDETSGMEEFLEDNTACENPVQNIQREAMSTWEMKRAEQKAKHDLKIEAINAKRDAALAEAKNKRDAALAKANAKHEANLVKAKAKYEANLAKAKNLSQPNNPRSNP